MIFARVGLGRVLGGSAAGGLAPLNALAKAVIAGMVRFFAAGERRARWFPRAFAAYYRLVLPGKPAAAQRERIVAAGPDMAPLLKQAWDSFRQPDAEVSKARARARLDQVATLAKRLGHSDTAQLLAGILQIERLCDALVDGEFEACGISEDRVRDELVRAIRHLFSDRTQ